MSISNIAKLNEIINEAEKSNINIRQLPAVRNNPALHSSLSKRMVIISTLLGLVAFFTYQISFNNGKCVVPMPDSLSHAFRPPEDCGFCQNVTQVDHISNISPAEFERIYAYNARPVVVTDATVNWTASDVFDFWYFKDVYESSLSDGEQLNCQFFPVRKRSFF